MKYMAQEINQIIELAYKGYSYDKGLQQEIGVKDKKLIQHYKSLLMEDQTLTALEILFNGIYPSLPKPEVADSPLIQTADKYPLEQLGLSARTFGSLTRVPLRTVADLLRMSDDQIVRIRGIGKGSKAMQEINEKRRQFIRDYNDGIVK